VHELLADGADLLLQRRAEHENLLLVRRRQDNLLDHRAHVCNEPTNVSKPTAGFTREKTKQTNLLHEAVALVEHKVLDVREVELLRLDELVDAAGRADNNVLHPTNNQDKKHQI
jgi:hypothetical protein